MARRRGLAQARDVHDGWVDGRPIRADGRTRSAIPRLSPAATTNALQACRLEDPGRRGIEWDTLRRSSFTTENVLDDMLLRSRRSHTHPFFLPFFFLCFLLSTFQSFLGALPPFHTVPRHGLLLARCHPGDSHQPCWHNITCTTPARLSRAALFVFVVVEAAARGHSRQVPGREID